MSVAETAIGIKTVNHWIGGEIVASKSGQVRDCLESRDRPATGAASTSPVLTK